MSLCCHLTPHRGFPPLKPLTGCVYQSKHRGQDGNASLLPSTGRKQRRQAPESCRPEHSTYLSSRCDCLRLLGHMFLCSGRYLVPDLCAHSLSRLSFLFLLTALRTCVKHLTSQRGHGKKTPAPRDSPSSSDSNCSILLSIYTRLCFPRQIFFAPSRCKSATARHSAETPPYATIETVHSSLLSPAGCSGQLLQNAPFLYLTLLFGERRRGPHRASHTFLPLALLPPLLIAALF